MKRNKRFVAITGGIGSGKSTVAKIIAEMGYPVFSADTVARGIYGDSEVYKKVAAHFPDCLNDTGVDRKKLAAAVFSDSAKLQLLDGITHPAIMQKLFAQMAECAGEAAFAEVPLLFECGADKDFDNVIVVMRDVSARIDSVMRRDGLTREEVAARIKNQYDYERNPNTGHTVLYNNGDFASLKDGVVRVVHEILGGSKS